ncbi:CheR family methyltransferase [Alteromonas oceanisediminis]|uniref:CheR family methyltransferase n=1 Tax=Alteromonas oceanisediminis TaxID=2836180 RepID=UPI001BDA5BD1|nr:CheR family methyltransferase [Alteromonas oceanisediminis]MBT0584969.1 chemotaxis protein CheR [Alteromonas oceanisediminis]
MLNREFSPENYQRFGRFLEQRTGIVLGDAKQYLVRSRLISFLHEYPDTDLDGIIDKAISGNDLNLQQRVIDAMTTNETLWFRDTYPFSLLTHHILPGLQDKQRLRIWSAACSTGQEAYSIAMTLLEYQSQHKEAFRGGFEIVGTDISRRVLNMAKSAHYDLMSVGRGLPAALQRKYFDTNEDKSVTAKLELQRCVTFKPLNLLESYTGLGMFDIIFCRNVLIYFSTDNKKKILQQIAAVLDPKGSLMLGASESVNAAADLFSMTKATNGLFYQHKPR